MNFDNMTVGGSVTVSEILAEIGLHEIPAGCDHEMSDLVDINVTVAKSEVLDELSDELEERSCEALRQGFEEIRKGDFAMALQLFARAFNDRELAAAEMGLRGQHSAGTRLPSPELKLTSRPRLAA